MKYSYLTLVACFLITTAILLIAFAPHLWASSVIIAISSVTFAVLSLRE